MTARAADHATPASDILDAYDDQKPHSHDTRAGLEQPGSVPEVRGESDVSASDTGDDR